LKPGLGFSVVNPRAYYYTHALTQFNAQQQPSKISTSKVKVGNKGIILGAFFHVLWMDGGGVLAQTFRGSWSVVKSG
jgi:hypothetical protein